MKWVIRNLELGEVPDYESPTCVAKYFHISYGLHFFSVEAKWVVYQTNHIANYWGGLSVRVASSKYSNVHNSR